MQLKAQKTNGSAIIISKKTKFTPSKLFEFHEQLMIGAFLINLTQFEKTGSMSKTFILLRNLIIKCPFRN